LWTLASSTIFLHSRRFLTNVYLYFIPIIRSSCKIFPESLYFWDTQNTTIIQPTFPSQYSPCANKSFVSNCKDVGNIPGSLFWKSFQLFRRILNDVGSITNAPSLQCWFQSREQVKISPSHVRWAWEMHKCCHIVFC
jgi:hypothetical protein